MACAGPFERTTLTDTPTHKEDIPMRFRGARDNTLAWIVVVVAAIIAVAAIWYFFFS
jgi:hypothetical protein